MIVKTANRIYEVDGPEQRFRLVHDTSGSPGALSDGQWQRFERMTPPTPGEPLRFFVRGDGSGRSGVVLRS